MVRFKLRMNFVTLGKTTLSAYLDECETTGRREPIRARYAAEVEPLLSDKPAVRINAGTAPLSPVTPRSPSSFPLNQIKETQKNHGRSAFSLVLVWYRPSDFITGPCSERVSPGAEPEREDEGEDEGEGELRL